MFFHRRQDWLLYGRCVRTVLRSDKEEGELKGRNEAAHYCLSSSLLDYVLSEGGVWATRERLTRLHNNRTQREFLCLTQSQFSMAQQTKQDINEVAIYPSIYLYIYLYKI